MKMILGTQELFYNDIAYCPSNDMAANGGEGDDFPGKNENEHNGNDGKTKPIPQTYE